MQGARQQVRRRTNAGATSVSGSAGQVPALTPSAHTDSHDQRANPNKSPWKCLLFGFCLTAKRGAAITVSLKKYLFTDFREEEKRTSPMREPWLGLLHAPPADGAAARAPGAQGAARPGRTRRTAVTVREPTPPPGNSGQQTAPGPAGTGVRPSPQSFTPGGTFSWTPTSQQPFSHQVRKHSEPLP